MKNSPHRNSAATLVVPTKSLRGKLMFAASAGILALVAPSGFYGMRAEAQTNVLPGGCIDDSLTDPDNNDDGRADANETIECVSVAPNTNIQRVATNVADLTVIVGEKNGVANSTVVGGANVTTNALNMRSSGVQTLVIESGGSVINDGDTQFVPTVTVNSSGSVSVTNYGLIENQSTRICPHLPIKCPSLYQL